MKPKKLVSFLQSLDTFTSPVLSLEQYATPPSIATDMLWLIDTYYGRIADKKVLDLGCGCGILSIGCALLGAKRVVGVDIDQNAIDIALSNVTKGHLPLSTSCVNFFQADVATLKAGDVHEVDMVIMNPPFGTKQREHADLMFVEKALELTSDVFSLHKTSTRKFWQQKVFSGVTLEVLDKIVFNLDQTLAMHKKGSENINVDLLHWKKK